MGKGCRQLWRWCYVINVEKSEVCRAKILWSSIIKEIKPGLAFNSFFTQAEKGWVCVCACTPWDEECSRGATVLAHHPPVAHSEALLLAGDWNQKITALSISKYSSSHQRKYIFTSNCTYILCQTGGTVQDWSGAVFLILLQFFMDLDVKQEATKPQMQIINF